MNTQLSVLRRFALIALLVNATTLVAQDVDGVDEPEIVVSGTRSEQMSVVIPASITVIDQGMIKNSGALNVVDVLKNRGAIQISDTYGDGSRSSINMRGLSASSNTLVLVDGRRLNNPDIGGPDLNSVAIKDVERIEIIQGSGSVLYGDQAVGGVINIITKTPESLSANVEYTAGSYEYERFRASVSQAFEGDFSFRLSAETRESENYRRHNEVEYSNVFARVAYDYGSGSVFVETQIIEDEQQNPGALLEAEMVQDRKQSIMDFMNDFTDVETDVSRFGIAQSFTEHWELLAEYTQREADGEFLLSFRGFPAPPVSATNPVNIQTREVTGVNPRLVANYDLDNGAFILTAGADLEESDYLLRSQFGTQSNNQEVSSFYAQGVIPVLPAADVTLGFRQAEVENNLVDRPTGAQGVPDNADLDDDISIASFGLTVQASDNLRHFIRFEENYRFAKVDEHTQSPVVPDFFGNAGAPLKTQTGESIEVGVEWQNVGNSAKAVLYQLKIEDEIIFDPTLFQNINIDSTEHKGAIIESSHALTQTLRLGFSYSWLDAEIISGAFDGKVVPFTAESVFGLSLDYDITDNFHAYIEANNIDDRYFEGDLANEVAQLEGHTVVNLQLAYTQGPWSATIRVNNLLDEEYSDSGAATTLYDPITFQPTNVGSFFPAPERNSRLTLAYYFD